MKKVWLFGITALLILTLTACGVNKTDASVHKESSATASASPSASTNTGANEQPKNVTIPYLGKDYTFPNPVKSIVAASLEGMEDAAALGIKPIGVLEVAGKIPDYLAKDLAPATLIGDKFAPNLETILALHPNAIIGTSKWDPDFMTKINKIATTLPYSHLSTDWKNNLLALGELTGKTDAAKKLIADYESKAATAKITLNKSAAGKDVVVIRIREGSLCIYAPSFYVNPVLYEDLGLKVPDIIAKADSQQEISLETLVMADPDVLFIQFETSENINQVSALNDLLANPIFSKLKAAKNKEVYTNVIAPLAQGGTAWSKTQFLDAAIAKLVK